MKNTILIIFILLMFCMIEEALGFYIKVDPLSRHIHITYEVPIDAPEEIYVKCSWSPMGKNMWQPAKVTPYISETALRFVRDEEWQEWIFQGRIRELWAQGLKRTLVFNPYPDAQIDGKVNIDFRIEICSLENKLICVQENQIQVDNSDVIYIEDWSKVFQKELIGSNKEEENRREWIFRSDLGPSFATLGNALIGKKWHEDIPLPQLSYPLDLRGRYAIYVCTPKNYAVRIRLSGDERSDTLSSPKQFEEVLWRWCLMDRQNLVLQQNHSYQGYVDSGLDYIKIVPLTDQKFQELEQQFGNKPNKVIIGYFEPYSWAFFEDIKDTLQHRMPIVAYRDAGVHIIDIQVGRFGMKVVYESRLTDQLIYNTIGDPIGDVIPHTSNVGKMQQFTNTLESELRYSHELGLIAHANFGATNCYPGTPLQSEVSKQHPEWMTDGLLRYDLTEVQAYILSLIRETLEIGADGVSIDFCRYPGGIDKPETCTQFLRKLKVLREEFARKRKKPVPLLLRFPAKGVSHWEKFDYAKWIKEELVDYLCPSNIQGRHMNFEIEPYVKKLKGSKCKLLPVVDGLSWGLDMPGPFLYRVKCLYDAGVDGIYIYQADARICINNSPDDRRCIKITSNSDAVNLWWKKFSEENQKYSRRIWLQPSEDGDYEYHKWERCRIWIEGIQPDEVWIYLDEKLVNKYTKPPYILGGEDYSYDELLSTGKHNLHIQAKSPGIKLSQNFTIFGAS
ncbi:MAG: hypothetical protein N3G21_05980 [Candidatus Hydrogenedentes bacterium]|nr:hypothetical protein [Candidatus Hydrogenedentota bacterium]